MPIFDIGQGQIIRRTIFSQEIARGVILVCFCDLELKRATALFTRRFTGVTLIFRKQIPS